MSDKRKHNEEIIEISRYLNHKMDDKERYDFECMLQKDPFLEEAVDGMSNHKISEIEKDINGIDLVKGKRKTNYKPLLWIAALVVIIGLIVLAVNFKMLQSSKQKTVSEDRIEDKLVFNKPIEQKKPIADSVQINNDSLKNSLENSIINQPVAPLLTVPIAGTPTVQNKNLPVKPLKETSKTTKKVVPEIVTTNVNVPTAKETTESKAESIVSDITNYEEPKKDEVPVSSTIKKRMGVNAKPSPLGGDASFKTFIDKNIKYPSGVEDQSKESVKLKFTVSTTGDIKNLELVKGPDNIAFANEAIRIVKSGPKWSPAVKDGIPVEEEVTLKINFKPEK